MRPFTAPLALFALACLVHCSAEDPSVLTDGSLPVAPDPTPSPGGPGASAPVAPAPAGAAPGSAAPGASGAGKPGPDTSTPVITPPTSGLSVSPSGSDSNPGTLAQPWKTLGHAVSRLKAGDVLYVHGGTYVESIYIGASGTASAPIRILAYPGERPVIDGQGRLPTGSWAPLVAIEGDYVEMSGFEVKSSNTNDNMGVVLRGKHGRLDRLNVHHNYHNGILVQGDGGVVENCTVWENARNNAGGVCQPDGMPIQCTWASGLSAARDPSDGITERVTVRHNLVYNNWGEGLSSYEASGARIEDNVVFNNWSVNLYVSDSWDTLVQRNLVFVTSDTPIVGKRRSPSNISLMDERRTAMNNPAIHPRSHDNVVVNNLVLGSNVCLFCYSEPEAVDDGAGLKNVLFAHNTIVDSALHIDALAHQGTRIVGNLFRSTQAGVQTSAGIVFANNAWSSDPGGAARGSGDFVGDARLAGTGSFSNTSYSVDFFRLTAASAGVLDAAAPLAAVTADFHGTPRGAHSDIGAVELVR